MPPFLYLGTENCVLEKDRRTQKTACGPPDCALLEMTVWGPFGRLTWGFALCLNGTLRSMAREKWDFRPESRCRCNFFLRLGYD